MTDNIRRGVRRGVSDLMDQASGLPTPPKGHPTSPTKAYRERTGK